jgi:hypothetical protein
MRSVQFKKTFSRRMLKFIIASNKRMGHTVAQLVEARGGAVG